MNLVWIVAALATGCALGLFYFLGLWITVRAVAAAPSPALCVLCSFVVRTGLLLGGLYIVMNGRWERLLACLAGFLLARLLLVHRLRDPIRQSANNT